MVAAAAATEGGEGDRSASVWRTGGGGKGVKAVVGVRRLSDPHKLVVGVEKTSTREGEEVVATLPPSSATQRGSTSVEMAAVA